MHDRSTHHVYVCKLPADQRCPTLMCIHHPVTGRGNAADRAYNVRCIQQICKSHGHAYRKERRRSNLERCMPSSAVGIMFSLDARAYQGTFSLNVERQPTTFQICAVVAPLLHAITRRDSDTVPSTRTHGNQQRIRRPFRAATLLSLLLLSAAVACLCPCKMIGNCARTTSRTVRIRARFVQSPHLNFRTNGHILI